MVSFIQNLPSKLIITEDCQPVLVLYHTFLINAEVRTTPFGHQLFDMGNLQVIISLLNNNLLE
jgi:hypothetical protein